MSHHQRLERLARRLAGRSAADEALERAAAILERHMAALAGDPEGAAEAEVWAETLAHLRAVARQGRRVRGEG
jgi:hypothetical protein